MNDELTSLLNRIACMYRKYGIKSVTMDDVSRELGISKKTLYQYFVDKNDLVNKIVDLEISQKETEFDAIASQNLNAIEEILEVSRLAHHMQQEYSPATEHDLRKYYPLLYEKIHQARRLRMYELILQNMKKGKEQGIFRKELNEEVIAKLYVSRLMSIFENSMFSMDELSRPEVINEILSYHIHGIANEKGLAILKKLPDMMEKEKTL